MFDIGKRIVELRKAANVNQKKLAELTGLRTSSVSEIESGKIRCSLQTLEKICEALHISLSDFFKSELQEVASPIIDVEKYEILKDSNVTVNDLRQALKVIEALKDK